LQGEKNGVEKRELGGEASGKDFLNELFKEGYPRVTSLRNNLREREEKEH